MSAPPVSDGHRADLAPYGLDVLLGRVVREWETRGRIFDLPTARFFDRDAAGVDLAVEFLGRPAATPIGPAAGPHTQLAQNIVLAYLGGARVFELKTVQVLDELVIGRPCIDMQTVGYNIEWSQELKIPASLEEYVKAWIALHLLASWDELRPHLGDPGPFVFDVSVGYDLDGIRSDPVAAFLDAMRDAAPVVDRLRALIPDPFPADVPVPPEIAGTATLSTFHGCPPGEIDSIVRHLMTRHGLDVVVKLNPTLLGYEAVDAIVHGRLGYDDVVLISDAFEEDLGFAEGVDLIGRLAEFAAAAGRRFGVKLTNTLVVANHKRWMPDERMYLSGPPLHVLAVALLDELSDALPGVLKTGTRGEGVTVSFSAGIGRDNLPDAVGLGLTPVTICTDLLKPGGYGRLAPMLKKLAAAMSAAGCADIAAWRADRDEAARRAGFRDAVAAYAASLAGEGAEPYTAAANSKLPRALDKPLQMWGCVACNLCVTVCPDDAVLRLPTPAALERELEDRWQYFVLAELCNDCGNCLTFCPEIGDPAHVKPRLYLDAGEFAAAPGRAFHVAAPGPGGPFTVTASGGPSADVDLLAAVLNAPEGFPVRHRELVAATTAPDH